MTRVPPLRQRCESSASPNAVNDRNGSAPRSDPVAEAKPNAKRTTAATANEFSAAAPPPPRSPDHAAIATSPAATSSPVTPSLRTVPSAAATWSVATKASVQPRTGSDIERNDGRGRGGRSNPARDWPTQSSANALIRYGNQIVPARSPGGQSGASETLMRTLQTNSAATRARRASSRSSRP